MLLLIFYPYAKRRVIFTACGFTFSRKQHDYESQNLYETYSLTNNAGLKYGFNARERRRHFFYIHLQLLLILNLLQIKLCEKVRKNLIKLPNIAPYCYFSNRSIFCLHINVREESITVFLVMYISYKLNYTYKV